MALEVVGSTPISHPRKRKQQALGSYPKGQFCKNTVYLERGMPYFAFVDTNAVLVRKIDRNKNAIFLLKPPFRIRRESVAKPIIVSILPFAKSFGKLLDFSLSKILHVPFG